MLHPLMAGEVTTLADAGPGSFRQAVAGARVTFSPALAGKVIRLSTPIELPNDTRLEIDASAAPGVEVSGGGICRILVIGGRSTVSITGLTFSGGRSAGSAYTDGGGAIFLSGMGTLTLHRCTFRDNQASGFGGAAIYAHWKHTTLIEDCAFIGNDSWACAGSERGAAAIGTGSFGSLTIRRTIFEGNKAAIGTINCMLSSLLVEDSVFTANLTEPKAGFGGAIYTDGASGLIDDEEGGEIVLRRCRFQGNVGASEGGAAFLFGYRKDAITVERCVFVDNRVEITAAKPGVAMGGALRLGGKALPYRITDSLFLGNRSAVTGGAIWAQNTDASRISNCLFDGNAAAETGGAISIANQGVLAIERCTLVGNEAKHGGAFFGMGPWATLSGSLVVENRHTNPWGINRQTDASLTDGGGNVIWPQHGGGGEKDRPVLASQVEADPQLSAPLAEGYLAPVRLVQRPELRGKSGFDPTPFASAPADPPKRDRRPVVERVRPVAQSERLTALAAEDAAVPTRDACVEILRAACQRPGALDGVRWQSSSFGDSDVVAADEQGITVAAFGSRTALPWKRLGHTDLVLISRKPALAAGPRSQHAWLLLSLYTDQDPDWPEVMPVASALLASDRALFDAYRTTLTRLRERRSAPGQ